MGKKRHGKGGCKTCRIARAVLEGRGGYMSNDSARRHLRTCQQADATDRALAAGTPRPQSESTVENGGGSRGYSISSRRSSFWD